MSYSSKKYSFLKSKLKNTYLREFKITLKDLRNLSDCSTSTWVQENLEDLKVYSEINWHFLEQLKRLVFFIKQPATLGKFEFGPDEELVFEEWNRSDFADYFLKSLNRGDFLGKASKKTSKIFDKHLTVLGERHILKNDKLSRWYRIQTSLGEIAKGKRVVKLLETAIHLNGKHIKLMTNSITETKKFSHRIEQALKLIQIYSPSSWERFTAFTEVIVPIKQKQFVSYSHQDLPGYSMINLYHRDFIDLMDDLIHENGHHHLNYYLNLGKLIEEPLDNIFYSPWRRTLRPLRGIYHAYFTFFWAFKLFADLARSNIQNDIYHFSPDEKEKIYWRVIEEYHMLNFSFKDLRWARKKGLINKSGWKLIEEQNIEMKKFSNLIPVWEKKLKKHKKDLIELKKILKNNSKLYSKN